MKMDPRSDRGECCCDGPRLAGSDGGSDGGSDPGAEPGSEGGMLGSAGGSLRRPLCPIAERSESGTGGGRLGAACSGSISNCTSS